MKDIQCPQCGALVPEGTEQCPVCAYRFSTVSDDSWKSAFVRIFSRKRVLTMVLVFVAELAIMFALTAMPMSGSTANQIVNQNEPSLQSVRALPLIVRSFSIFSHNYEIASIEIIPVIGQIFFLISTYSTAIVLNALAISQGVTGPLALLSLLLLPYSWLELPSYAIATTEGAFLIYSLFTKHFRKEIKTAVIVWLMVGLELLTAGIFESWTIALESSNNLSLLFITWIPYAVIIAIFVIVVRHVVHRFQTEMAMGRS
ncbi:zinc ribbon domain-containing protein [Thermoplasma sp. Kam2015]|uniref:zinc ribbon domain-containing protein n=1 Tax=Thermoplasma sp. Kam2015 TaxID=2094122 RepID=UPI000D883B68|nr:zinc ribbon domain-containing protein [Thermoplasma sp. Kam2015]PYB67653.1 zinc ribbon domain-containing protein [Thermoplasma sp. Kam2015]